MASSIHKSPSTLGQTSEALTYIFHIHVLCICSDISLLNKREERESDMGKLAVSHSGRKTSSFE